MECLETRGTVAGRSLHGMSLVVVVFLVEELILYAELLGVAGLRVETLYLKKSCSSCRNCWIVCGNTTVSVLEDRLKNLSLDLLSPLLWK